MFFNRLRRKPDPRPKTEKHLDHLEQEVADLRRTVNRRRWVSFAVALSLIAVGAVADAGGRARAGGGGIGSIFGLPISPSQITVTNGLICFNAACTAKCQFTGGNLTCNGMTIIQGDSGQLIESLGTGAAGAYYASAGAFRTDLTTAPQFICGGASACGFQGVSGQTTQVDCGGGTCSATLGVTNATTTTVGRSGQTTNINGTVAVGGGSTFTKYLTGTVAVTGGSVTAGTCANQGSAITVTGAASGDACYVGLTASPGNGLSYGCVAGANTCQLYACNGSAGALTSVTQTERCTVIH